MLNLYETYESADLREADACFESALIDFERAHLALSLCESMEELDFREAEVRCFSESGDGSTLTAYYEAAKEKAEEKREGLVKRAWEKVTKLFQTIKEKLFGKSTKIDEKAKYAIDPGALKDLPILEKAYNQLKALAEHPVRNALKAIAAVAALFGTLWVTKKAASKAAKTDSGKKIIEGSKLAQAMMKGLRLTNDGEKLSKQQAKSAGNPENSKEVTGLFGKFTTALSGVTKEIIFAAKKPIYKHEARKNLKDDELARQMFDGRMAVSVLSESGEDTSMDGLDALFMEDSHGTIAGEDELFNEDTSFEELLDSSDYEESAGDDDTLDALLAIL